MKITTRRRIVLGAGVAATVALIWTAANTLGSDDESGPNSQIAASGRQAADTSASPSHSRSASRPTTVQMRQAALPGMPEYDPTDLYAADRPNQLSSVVKNFPSFVYVPNTESNTVSVIDPATYKVVRTVPVGEQPQHVVPSWDLKTLWVNNDLGNSLTPINPATGQFGTPVSVHDPYNLYFTPDGKSAVVMAEADREIVFRDPHTMAIQTVLHVPCEGVNHADFSPDGSYFIASCEFSGQLLKVDTAKHTLLGELDLEHGAMPQDVKISPDGRVWYVADMETSGVWTLNGDTFKTTGFIPTGLGAHGLYVSRDSKSLYITNRGEGSISVLDFATGKLVAKWKIPGHASPDMGGVSADGKVLWLTGRYDAEVYAVSTTDGHLIARIPVGDGPHGLCVYPQPGRYSLGHTGIFR
ncbi:MAG TPA: YncE family protein [Actinospica sp.]|nr:YncE family protein [Actinospica sp.]